MYLVNRMSSLSQKVDKYFVWWYLPVDFPHIYFSLRYFALVFGGALEWDAICSCEEYGRATGGSCGSREVNCFVLWEFSLRLLDSKEELDWLWVFECWLLDFADIMLRTVLWVSTSFLIISSFVQRFCFRRYIFF